MVLLVRGSRVFGVGVCGGRGWFVEVWENGIGLENWLVWDFFFGLVE